MLPMLPADDFSAADAVFTAVSYTRSLKKTDPEPGLDDCKCGGILRNRKPKLFYDAVQALFRLYAAGVPRAVLCAGAFRCEKRDEVTSRINGLPLVQAAGKRPGQNLDRARTQFTLVRGMEAQWEEMQAAGITER